MKTTVRKLMKSCFGIMIRLGIVWPLVIFFARVVEDASPGRASGRKNIPTILALTPERFRGDLEILAATGEFRILKVPFYWQARLRGQFFPTGPVNRWDIREYFCPEPGSVIAGARSHFRDFLRRFLPPLYKRLGVNCVVSAAFHYAHDVDWGAVSEELGHPFVIFHRENLKTNTGHRNHSLELCRKLGKLVGKHIITHNEVMRRLVIESGFAAPEQVSSLGCLRMDEFLNKVREVKVRINGRKRVTLFSFAPGAGLLALGIGNWPKDPSVGWWKLFERTHAAFAELASEHPEVEFVIKPKWGETWSKEIRRVIGINGIDLARTKNLTILPDVNAQKIILSSNVVVGYGSSTLLEAAIAGKPVVMPYFDEARRDEYQDHVQYGKELHLFNLAESPAQLKKQILDCLKNPSIAPEVMRAREEAFERYISGLEGKAVKKYAELLKRLIAERGENLNGKAIQPIAAEEARIG